MNDREIQCSCGHRAGDHNSRGCWSCIAAGSHCPKTDNEVISGSAPERLAGVHLAVHEQNDKLRAEIERLTECLKRANDGFEHFEREWYLSCDRNEKLVAALHQALDWSHCVNDEERARHAEMRKLAGPRNSDG